jgi:thiol-disulfide isomerase/thioredoxin
MNNLLLQARRRIRPLLGLLCACAAPAAAWSAPATTNATLKVGEVFPDLAKYELAGELPASLKGRIVVVDFWASWCGPCQKTFPFMEELHHRYGKRGLVILAVNEDKSRAAMDEFLKEHPVTFTVVRDAKRKLAAEIKVPALPTSYLLDGMGRVQSIQPGARTARNSKDFTKEIEALLEQNSPKP